MTVVCELLNRKSWSSGFDGKKHGLVKKMIKPFGASLDFYNLIDFSKNNMLRKIVNQTAVNWNWLSCYSHYCCFEKMAEAKGTFLVSPDRFGTYIAGSLERDYGVPYIETPFPYGFQSTDAFLSRLGKTSGAEIAFKELVQRQHQQFDPQLESLSGKLQGTSCLPIVSGNLSPAFSDMLSEWGVAEMSLPNQRTSIREGMKRGGPTESDFFQGYRLLPLIEKLKPDVMVVSHYSLTSWEHGLVFRPFGWRMNPNF
jgi:nitrogenase molybdenum-iron protein alpha/beta subunit